MKVSWPHFSLTILGKTPIPGPKTLLVSMYKHPGCTKCVPCFHACMPCVPCIGKKSRKCGACYACTKCMPCLKCLNWSKTQVAYWSYNQLEQRRPNGAYHLWWICCYNIITDLDYIWSDDSPLEKYFVHKSINHNCTKSSHTFISLFSISFSRVIFVNDHSWYLLLRLYM